MGIVHYLILILSYLSFFFPFILSQVINNIDKTERNPLHPCTLPVTCVLPSVVGDKSQMYSKFQRCQATSNTWSVEEIACIIAIWVAVGGVLCGGSIRVVERMGHIIKCYLASGDKHTSYSPLSGSYIASLISSFKTNSTLFRFLSQTRIVNRRIF